LGLVAGTSAAAGKSGLQVRLGAAGQAHENELETVWGEELDRQPVQATPKPYVSPIKRVVSLLKKMKAELEAEADKESEMYDKMVCWCETNEKEKTKAIADADAKDKELSAEIEARAAKFGEQSTEIAQLKKQIAEDTAALKEATAIREKTAAAFSDTEKELMQNIANVKNAIEVLSKHHSSFLQAGTPIMTSVRAVLRDLAFKHEMLLADARDKGNQLSLFQRGANSDGATGDALLSALNAVGANVVSPLPLDIAQKMLERAAHQSGPSGTGFLQADLAPSAGSYAPQSGQIFGILNTLKEDFELNLSQEQKEEQKSIADFKALSAAKRAQIASAKEKLDSNEQENAENQKALSDAKEDLELTRDQRSKDVEFLRNLKLTCQDLDRQWEERSKTRGAETKAVSEAIAIITEDDNMDLLRDTVKFLQVDSEEGSEMRMRRSRVVSALRKAAQDPFFATEDLMDAWHSRKAPVLSATGGPRAQLSTLAVSASLDSFTQVKKAMDKMLADLKEEQENEVHFKAHCDKEFKNTDQEQFRKNEQKKDLETEIEKLDKLFGKKRCTLCW